MSDVIRLSGVRATGRHGVFDRERRDGQEFVVDVEIRADLTRPGHTDDLAHTVNYGEIGAEVVRRIEGPPVDLIERLAALIADDTLAHDLVDEVTVTVHKPQAPVGVPFVDVTVSVTRRREPTPVVVALGANLGDPVATLEEAVLRLVDELDLTDVALSAWFETDPVGGPDQPAYVNGVLTARTRRSAPAVLAGLHRVEADFGRVREVRWGARTLDLDLVQVGVPGAASEVRSDAGDLTLPHPRAHERAFVLVPWLDVDEDAALRVGERVVPVRDLLARIGTEGVRERST